jgi:type I restriction enzyme M protein
MSSTQSGEGEMRRALIEGEVVDCMIALPGQLFYSTQIPACLWFLAKDKSNGLAQGKKLRDRRGEVLFIDARKLGDGRPDPQGFTAQRSWTFTRGVG